MKHAATLALTMIFVIGLLIGSNLPVVQAAPAFLPVTGADLAAAQAPDAGTGCPVITYKIKLPKPTCFFGGRWCRVLAWVPINGRKSRLVQITGRNLREDQLYSGKLEVCGYGN